MVKRTVNGTERRYIERMHSRFISAIEDSFFVDSGLSYTGEVGQISGATQANPVVITVTGHSFSDGDTVRLSNLGGMTELHGRSFTVANVTANTFELSGEDGTGHSAYTSGGAAYQTTTTVTGLDHLEGETVSILADGSVIPQQVVSGGSLTLAHGANKVHAGLPYVSEIETLNVESPEGTVAGKQKKIDKVLLKLLKSRGGWAGPDTDNLQELKPDQITAYGEPTPLITGEREIEMEPHWDSNGRLIVRQADPLPMTITAIVPELSVGG